jgi:LysR family transcriptional regulator, hca operon transcriptional activator
MELRHLRYFVAVADSKSLTLAAEHVLHTTQPSLSRQIRDLEEEVGVQLFARSSRGLTLTEAGRTFLNYARSILSQVHAAVEATRRVGLPSKPRFSLGFLTGHELDWLPEAMGLLHNELPNINVMITSQISPDLAKGLAIGTLDAAFMRREEGPSELSYKLVIRESLEVFMPSDHSFAKRKSVDPAHLEGQAFLNMSATAPALRKVIDKYLHQHKLHVIPRNDVDNLAMAMSLIASTRSIALLPIYARNFATWAVTSRPLKGKAPTIDLVLGYNRSNPSPVLKVFLARLEEIVQRVAQKGSDRSALESVSK